MTIPNSHRAPTQSPRRANTNTIEDEATDKTSQCQTGEAPLSRRDFLLYATTVFAWSASWYALKVNTSYSVSPSVSTCWRFLLAAAIMFVFCLLSKRRLTFHWHDHRAFALLGVFLFSTNFILFNYASLLIVSGLMAVVFSLASIFNLLIGALRGELAGPRRWIGAVMGVVGILLLYWPTLNTGEVGGLGLVLCLCGTLSFCIGNQVSQSLKGRDIPVMSASAWGMLYGALWSAIVSYVAGYPFIYDSALDYTLSLLYLSIISTVLAFWAYLNLLRSIGAGRAAYATVMFPIFALLLSTWLEGYDWTRLAIAGVVLSLCGNLFVLRSIKQRGVTPPSPVV